MFLLCIVLSCQLSFAQIGLTDLFAKSFEVVNEKSGKERFKGQILKGKRNGMGSVLTKKGVVYIGDFYRDEMTGIGMMVAADDTFIENCEGSVVYVGNWKDGQKSGIGKCYDIDGCMIYKGSFADDKPIGDYPTQSTDDDNVNLSLINIGDNMFFGETTDGIPNGHGVMIYPDGSLWYHSFKGGTAKGIGLYVDYTGEWETLKMEDGKTVTISSSARYRQIDHDRKTSLRNALLNTLNDFIEDMGQQQTIINASRRTETAISGDAIVDNDISSVASTSSVMKSSRCKECGGNGNCTGGTKPSARYHCHGSGKCGWCLGDGFNYAAGHPVKCKACYKGKCKYCGGTGKCSTCKGTGRI